MRCPNTLLVSKLLLDRRREDDKIFHTYQSQPREMLTDRLLDEIGIASQRRTDSEVVRVSRQSAYQRIKEDGVWRRFAENHAERLIALHAQIGVERATIQRRPRSRELRDLDHIAPITMFPRKTEDSIYSLAICCCKESQTISRGLEQH